LRRALSGIRDVDSGLPLEAATLAEVLKKQGYATACFGKWHLGYKPPFLPPSQGFDEFRGLTSGDGDFHTHINRAGGEDWWHNNSIEMQGGYTTELLTKYSVDFIERHCDQPFFLYVPHLAIHFPWQGPDDPPHREKGKDYAKDKWGIIPDRSNVQPHIKAMVEALDKSVGAIMAALKRHGLAENTLVVFTSDNGGYITYGKDFRDISSNGSLRGQKSQVYEGGHRVPMMVRWPGKIRPGVTDATGHSTDLFPTIGKLAGASLDGLRLDGVDLAPLWFGRQALPERMLFLRTAKAHAVRSGPWKLCVHGRRMELYNLDGDLGETDNLAKQMPEKVEQLSNAWKKWNADVNRSAEKYENEK